MRQNGRQLQLNSKSACCRLIPRNSIWKIPTRSEAVPPGRLPILSDCGGVTPPPPQAERSGRGGFSPFRDARPGAIQGIVETLE